MHQRRLSSTVDYPRINYLNWFIWPKLLNRQLTNPELSLSPIKLIAIGAFLIFKTLFIITEKKYSLW